MSHFYGQVEGFAETNGSRRGSKSSGIKASAQSWDGSVIVKMFDDHGTTKVEIQIDDDDSTFYGERCFVGTIEELRERLKGGG